MTRPFQSRRMVIYEDQGSDALNQAEAQRIAKETLVHFRDPPKYTIHFSRWEVAWWRLHARLGLKGVPLVNAMYRKLWRLLNTVREKP